MGLKLEMTELSAMLLHRSLRGSHLAETHNLRREGSRVIILRKKELQLEGFDEGNKAFILAQAATAIQEASQETGNKRVTFGHRHPRPFSLEVKFRYKKRGEE